MVKINIYFILAILTWLLANIFVPLLRNSIERIYKKQIDFLLTRGFYCFKTIFWRLLQLMLILFFWPTLLSKIPNFMRVEAQKEYEPVADTLLDRSFPQKMIVSWKMVRGTIFAFSFAIVVIVILVFISQFLK